MHGMATQRKGNSAMTVGKKVIERRRGRVGTVLSIHERGERLWVKWDRDGVEQYVAVWHVMEWF